MMDAKLAFKGLKCPEISVELLIHASYSVSNF